MTFCRLGLICLILSFSGLALASLPVSKPVPGGILVLPLQVNALSAPSVTYAGHKVMVVNYQHRWYGVVGISLATKPGSYQLQLHTAPHQAKSLAFTVLPQRYPAQYLTIKNQRLVHPNANDLQRIAKEQAMAQKLKFAWTEEVPDLPFAWPVKGRISSAFGLKRFYNQQPRAAHAGLDIAAPLNTPVKAPANARVLATGDFMFSGKTLYLDHGQGLLSMYGHLNAIAVKPGQRVHLGDVIGYVGKTGRATGPHLHWAVLLNAVYVNPALLLQH